MQAANILKSLVTRKWLFTLQVYSINELCNEKNKLAIQKIDSKHSAHHSFFVLNSKISFIQ